MALAYTAPTWTDGSGEGISASNLQAISDCIEGLVQGTDKAIHTIAMANSTITVTFADGTQETVTATGLKGVSSITKTSTVGLVDTYTITYTDGSTATYTVTNGKDGQDGQDGTDGRDGAIQYTAGNGIDITSNTISADVQSVSVAGSGTASASVTHQQQVTVNGSATDIDGTKYMQSTANSATFTFTNAAITADSAIDVYTDTWGDNPSAVTVSAGSCTVTFGSAQTRTVRIYIK